MIDCEVGAFNIRTRARFGVVFEIHLTYESVFF